MEIKITFMRVTGCISRFPYFCKSVKNPLSVIGSDEVTGSTPVISLPKSLYFAGFFYFPIWERAYTIKRKKQGFIRGVSPHF